MTIANTVVNPKVLLDQLRNEASYRNVDYLLSAVDSVCQSICSTAGIGLSVDVVVTACDNAGLFQAKHFYSSTVKCIPIKLLVNNWVSFRYTELAEIALRSEPKGPDLVVARALSCNPRRDKAQTILQLHAICGRLYEGAHTDFSVGGLLPFVSEEGGMSKATLRLPDPKALADAWQTKADKRRSPNFEQPEDQERASADLNLGWMERDYPEAEEWRQLAVAWLRTIQDVGPQHHLAAIRYFVKKYLITFCLPLVPAVFLSRTTVLPSFWQEVCKDLSAGVTYTNYIHKFLNWVLLRDYSETSDDGRRWVSPAFYNPVQTVSSSDGGKRHHNDESVQPTLPYGYIDELRETLIEGPNFGDWKWAQNAVGVAELTQGRPPTDWFEVSEDMIDINDPDCVWRRRAVTKGEPKLEMWSPVRWVCCAVKMQLPLRTFQVRMLDSGEADSMRYVAGKWTENTGPLRNSKNTATKPQGVFRQEKGRFNDPDSTLIYVNTNKSADKKKGTKEKGYAMPWVPFGALSNDVFYWLEKLRNWQEKYNPIDAPLPWKKLGAKYFAKKSEKQLMSYPHTCFLFRTPETSKGGTNGYPLANGIVEGAWANLLVKFQERLQERGECHANGDPIILVLGAGGPHLKPVFPLHSLRVSLITALALDGEVPYDVLMKVVGHSRLLMTLYYTKFGHSRFADALKAGAQKLMAKREAGIVGFLKTASRETLVSKVFASDITSLFQIIPEHPAARNPAGWMPMHLGMCLAGGNTAPIEGTTDIAGCFNGGPKVKVDSRMVNSPVPGGSRNCIRCRWLVTDASYFAALVAQFNNISYRLGEVRDETVRLEVGVQNIRRRKAAVENDGRPFLEQGELTQAQRLYDSQAVKFNSLCGDLMACMRLIRRCEKALEDDFGLGDSLIAVGSADDVKAALEETDSELLQLIGVCEDAEIYPDLDAGTATLRLGQFLDSAFYNEGLPPILMSLPQRQQLAVANKICRKLAAAAQPNDVIKGRREIVSVLDAGERLSTYLGIDLKDFVAAEVGTSISVLGAIGVTA